MEDGRWTAQLRRVVGRRRLSSLALVHYLRYNIAMSISRGWYHAQIDGRNFHNNSNSGQMQMFTSKVLSGSRRKNKRHGESESESEREETTGRLDKTSRRQCL